MKGLLFALMLGLAACSTPYQESGLTGGVRAVPLGGDVYRVEAGLNAYSSRSMVQDYLLLRAAETAIEQGAIGFVVLNSENTTRQRQIVTPGTATTTANATAFGNTAYGTATTTYSPAMAHTVVSPGGIMMIGLVREAPANGQFFNAQEIIAAIGPRVQRR